MPSLLAAARCAYPSAHVNPSCHPAVAKRPTPAAASKGAMPFSDWVSDVMPHDALLMMSFVVAWFCGEWGPACCKGVASQHVAWAWNAWSCALLNLCTLCSVPTQRPCIRRPLVGSLAICLPLLPPNSTWSGAAAVALCI